MAEKHECGSSNLKDEFWRLFNLSSEARNRLGYTDRLRRACVLYSDINDQCDTEEEEETDEQPTSQCDCDDGESCPLCEKDDDLKTISAVEEATDTDPLDDIGMLMSNTKQFEFISLAINSYAAVGNKPFVLKNTTDIPVSDEQLKDASQAFYEYLEDFIETNNVLVTEIADAFDVVALRDLAETLSESIKYDIDKRVEKDTKIAEQSIRNTFNKTELVKQYLEVLRDITIHPLGILWAEHLSTKDKYAIDDGELTCSTSLEPDAFRVDPAYCWFTPDWKYDKEGRGVFRREQLSYGDLELLKDKADGCFKANIKEILSYEEPVRIPSTSLFEDELYGEKMNNDCIVGRCYVRKKHLEELDIDIPDCSKHDRYVLAEIWLCGDKLIRAIAIPKALGIGVYTTTYRRYDSSIYGLSLNDFLRPFVSFYSSVIKGISKSVGKNVGSLIMLDTAVIDDPMKYLTLDENGVPTIDFQDDMVIEFDSSEADLSPNFKGVPVIVQKFPTDLPTLLPLLGTIEGQIERLTGIPSFLTQGGNISSAIRTEEMLNTVNESNSVTIKAMLHEHEERILRRIIQFFFFAKVENGDFTDLFLQTNPEILLNSQITREFNDDRRKVTNFAELSPYIQQLAPEQFAAQVNELAREVYGYTDDLIPVTNPLVKNIDRGVAPQTPPSP